MFRASSVPIIRSYQLYTWQLVCFVKVVWPLPMRVRLEVGTAFKPDSPRQRPHKLHETYQLSRVQLITPDDMHSRCPKHVEFRDKIKFWILDASCWLFTRCLSCCIHFLGWFPNWRSVPKRRNIKFRRRGIAQKKEYDTQNTAKIWNQDYYLVYNNGSVICLLMLSIYLRS